jgi:parvulin-like peptidyl-prolyl isomerase
MSEQNANKSMLLFTSDWAGAKSFRLMPIQENCPFIEGLYDPTQKVLVMISKQKKESLHMLAKLNEQGDAQKLKTPRPNGKPFPEERKTIETYQEYYIVERKEIEEIIEMFAANTDVFNYKEFLEKDITIPEQPKIQLIAP